MYYLASTSPLTDANVTSSSYLFVPKFDAESSPNDVVCFVGSSDSLPASIASVYGGGGADCTAANGCGVHVHAGTGCEDKEAQGGHWWNAEVLAEDPWKIIGYKQTSAEGYGQYAACVSTGFDLASDPELLVGQAFIVHAEDGSRASCGIIESAPEDFVPTSFSAKMEPIPGVEGEMTGEVVVMTGLSEVSDVSCYMGCGMGLEVDVESFLLGTGSETCDVANGCGAHIHSGYGCGNKTEQGGHYFDSLTISEDPWKLESYYSTDSEGTGFFYGCAITGEGASEYEAKPFVVHNTAGGRVLCGVLEAPDEESSAATKSIVGLAASIVIGLALF